jgi:hypothetical protein
MNSAIVQKMKFINLQKFAKNLLTGERTCGIIPMSPIQTGRHSSHKPLVGLSLKNIENPEAVRL